VIGAWWSTPQELRIAGIRVHLHRSVSQLAGAAGIVDVDVGGVEGAKF